MRNTLQVLQHLLNAVAIARTNCQEPLVQELVEMIDREILCKLPNTFTVDYDTRATGFHHGDTFTTMGELIPAVESCEADLEFPDTSFTANLVQG